MNNLNRCISSLIFKAARLLEKSAYYAQGKGYGSATIKQENKLVHQFLKNAPALAIDIGGNIGEYSAELRRRNPNLEIHIFEPSSVNIEKLKKRFEGDKNVKVMPYAISNSEGSATLFSNRAGSPLGSLTKRKIEHHHIKFNEEEIVNTIKFENYWSNNLGKRNIDIVKIDIEGHELSALEGFGEALLNSHIIQFEFGGCNIDTRTFFQDFWNFFYDRNFKIYRITPFGSEKINIYREYDEFFSTVNYIAVNKKFK